MGAWAVHQTVRFSKRGCVLLMGTPEVEGDCGIVLEPAYDGVVECVCVLTGGEGAGLQCGECSL